MNLADLQKNTILKGNNFMFTFKKKKSKTLLTIQQYYIKYIRANKMPLVKIGLKIQLSHFIKKYMRR